MRKALGALALLSAGLLAASQTTLAQTTQADVVINPTNPINDGTVAPGNSNLILSVWSPSQPQSLIYNTGMTYLQMQASQITPNGGLVLDFGNIPTAAWDAISGAPDLVYDLVAVDGSGTNAARGVLTTAALGTAVFAQLNGDVAAITGSNSFANIAGQVNGACAATNPCLTVDAQQIAWDDHLSGKLAVSAAASVGTALGFYSIVGQAPANNAGTPALVSVFSNANGFGTWLLTSAGHLTYTIAGGTSPVPLPGAIWLLMSGIAGFGAISRRRNAA
jgi:hypothetical protein